MLPDINKVKGVHPGAVLARELKARKLRKGRFAISIQEYPQVITDITKNRRGITPSLSIRLGHVLDCDSSYFMVLQSHFEVEKEKKRMILLNQKTPDLSKIRMNIFWDTDPETIDWQKNSRAVITRVFERGNPTEVEEIIRFYGKRMVKRTLQNTETFLPSVKKIMERFKLSAG